MLILLLEDELMLQGAISEYLTDLGYKVDVFENADEVYEHVMHKKYDLFIFDINTPGITGLELLTRLQSKTEQSDLIKKIYKIIFNYTRGK